jgi:hypothetical protein
MIKEIMLKISVYNMFLKYNGIRKDDKDRVVKRIMQQTSYFILFYDTARFQ